jgi:hypothetical protein
MCSNWSAFIAAGIFLFSLSIPLTLAPVQVLTLMTRWQAFWIKRLLDDEAVPPAVRHELRVMRDDPDATARAVPGRSPVLWFAFRTVTIIGAVILWSVYLAFLYNALQTCYFTA